MGMSIPHSILVHDLLATEINIPFSETENCIEFIYSVPSKSLTTGT